jgi:hypothetical protein
MGFGDPKMGFGGSKRGSGPQKWGLGPKNGVWRVKKGGLDPKNGVWDPKMGSGDPKMGFGGQKGSQMAKMGPLRVQPGLAKMTKKTETDHVCKTRKNRCVMAIDFTCAKRTKLAKLVPKIRIKDGQNSKTAQN